ncbi:gemin 2 isoform X2 [Rhodnius prolixus]|uniref:gemin 2 isoform X2 n=1 Tax=Rhodnius prolixus TaxID=13249 RepID=UPI003D18CD43
MDGEEDILLERALIVDDEFCKFNPAETPTNGHEYLLTVRNEARKCPAVIAAHVNRKKLKQQTFYVSENSKPKISNLFLPTEEWQRWQCEEFERVRADVSSMRSSPHFQRTHHLQVPEDDAEEDQWFQYCFDIDCKQEKYPLLTQVLVLKQDDENDELLVRLNLIICIVGKYFRQIDLADN